MVDNTSPEPSPNHSRSSSPIWSSRSPSPISSARTSAHSSHDSAQSNTEPGFFSIPQSIEGSEQPLLARTHYTNGYRAGISAGKDDPEIAQTGFDEGFPLGAELAMRVGYLLEMVKEILAPREDTDAGKSGHQTKREETSPVGASNVYTFAQAEGELDLANLVQEGEHAGLLGPDVSRDGTGAAAASSSSSARAPSFVDQLPSVMKWTRIVEEVGRTSTHG